MSFSKSLNCSLTCSSDRCIFQDLSSKKTIGQGSLHEGLYYFQSPSVLAVIKPPSIDLWHWRLGHLSHHSLQKLSSTISFITCSNNKTCEICPQAKQCRLPFSSSSITTDKPFQLIPRDIWGPFSQSSLNGSRYFLTIVDDFSRCRYI